MIIPGMRPHVILNVAVTADGKTDTMKREGANISSVEDMARVDQLRAEVDAVMVGGRTLLDNDPRLTVKSEALRSLRIARGLDPNPVKVGVVTRAVLKPRCRFLTYGPARVIIFTTSQTPTAEVEFLQAQGVKLFIMGEKKVDLGGVMQELWRESTRRVLVEGGGTLNDELFRLQLVDEIYIYQAAMIFGGRDAPTFVDGKGFSCDEAVQLHLADFQTLADNGVILHYLPRYR